MKKEIVVFLIIPLLFNALFIGLYFSGVDSLQNLIAPRMVANVHEPSWREFGLVEQFQNILLLCMVVVFSLSTLKREMLLEKLFFGAGAVVAAFIFLEEIDYGLHFYHYFTGQALDIVRLNLHNQQTASGGEYGNYLKSIDDIAKIIWFVIIPLLLLWKRVQILKTVAPNPWLIITLIIGFLGSSLAHVLNDAGFATIDGYAGSLDGNISEFRETSSYYVYFLYGLQLTKTRPLFEFGSLKMQS